MFVVIIAVINVHSVSRHILSGTGSPVVTETPRLQNTAQSTVELLLLLCHLDRMFQFTWPYSSADTITGQRSESTCLSLYLSVCLCVNR